MRYDLDFSVHSIGKRIALTKPDMCLVTSTVKVCMQAGHLASLMADVMVYSSPTQAAPRIYGSMAVTASQHGAH